MLISRRCAALLRVLLFATVATCTIASSASHGWRSSGSGGSGGSGGAAFLIDWEWAGVYDVVHDLSKLVLLCELDEADGDEVLQLYFGANLTDVHRCRMKLWFLHTTSREALWYERGRNSFLNYIREPAGTMVGLGS